MLISGGGAHNTFLIKALQLETKHQLIIPDSVIVDFKEALIFGFMGVLRNLEKTNCLASVTGAKTDSSSGNIFIP